MAHAKQDLEQLIVGGEDDDDDDDEIVFVECTWSIIPDLCKRNNLRSDPPDLEGLRELMGLTRDEFNDRVAKHDGVYWLRDYMTYHDGQQYHPFEDDQEMPRSIAEARGASPCPVCYPDDGRNDWMDIYQTVTGSGTMTTVTPKPLGSDAEDGGANPEPDPDSERDDVLDPMGASPFEAMPPDVEAYFATAKMMYPRSQPSHPEAGPVRTDEEQYEYIREHGGRVREDPDGTVHLLEVPSDLKIIQATLAQSTDRPLFEAMGFSEMPRWEEVEWAVDDPETDVPDGPPS